MNVGQLSDILLFIRAASMEQSSEPGTGTVQMSETASIGF